MTSEMPPADAQGPTASAESPAAKDITCLNCGYNLRTLRSDAICPECGRPVAQSMTRGPRLDGDGRIDEDVTCIRCGYNLRTLRTDASCPECDMKVWQSTHGYLLRFSDPTWVRRLTSGAWLIVAGILAAALVGILNSAALLLIHAGWIDRSWVSVERFGWALATVGAVIVVGFWRLTTPQPGLPDTGRPIAARGATRRFLVTLVALAILLYAVAELTQPPVFQQVLQQGWRRLLRDAAPFVLAILVAASLIGLLAAFNRYGQDLALRIPDAGLARSCAIVLWGWLLAGAGWTFTAMAEMSNILPRSVARVWWISIWQPVGPLLTLLLVIWTAKLIARYYNQLRAVTRQMATPIEPSAVQ